MIRDDGRDQWGMCKISERMEPTRRPAIRAITRADARYICMWRSMPACGSNRTRNCFPTLAEAVANLARRPAWGPDHVWDARHNRVAFVVVER